MTNEERMLLAKEIFTEPGQKARAVNESQLPDLIVTFEDEYGEQECTVTRGYLHDETELRKSLEAFKRGRAEKIGKWLRQKKLSAEIVGHLNGEPDETSRMSWLPKRVYGRFLDDFRLRFPHLEKLMNDPESADKAMVIKELESIPFSWQKSP